MIKILLISIFFILPSVVHSENYLLDGKQESEIAYRMVQQVTSSPDVTKLWLNYVVPVSYDSPTYSQTINDINLVFSPEPISQQEVIDKRGNRLIEAVWELPVPPITVTISFSAENKVKLEKLTSNAPFPVRGYSEEIGQYLESTEQVKSSSEQIREKALELTAGATTEYDAVQRIFSWVVDHMQYVLTPQHYDADYSFLSGKGNCQNYSHLAAALMRASGIPVRIVNGITLDRPYDIELEDFYHIRKMGQGRHSWIEVFFPDLGWVPFDPQATEFFVSNRFIRVETGIDNRETKDGRIRWTYTPGKETDTEFRENIEADFIEDTVQIKGTRADYGPRSYLYSPRIEASFTRVPIPPPLMPPRAVPPPELLKEMTYSAPFIFGNLEFPEGVDFAFTRVTVRDTSEGIVEMRKNFLVETAEYVTTRGKQYAQTFILEKPLHLDKIGLALRRFNSDGQLWLELHSDSSSTPGDYMATSEIINLDQIDQETGYYWVDFDFTGGKTILSPGRYWVLLGYTGSPIINWFFTYGKPVGPQDGTRYKTVLDETWSRSLNFEFNYRIAGLTAE
jgi:transglutaminase-like putative cysteine protease